LAEAVRLAKQYVTEAIRHGLSIGAGHGPTDHFYFLGDE
jgi:hydroxymethylpyrimidine/phosphomethylpyrimidine kinase